MTSLEFTAGCRYRLIDKPDRVYSVDVNDIEICGARRPFGHDHWTVYATPRVAQKLHQVIAMTRADAVAHVEMISELFTRVSS